VLCYRLSAESGNNAVAEEKAVKMDSDNMSGGVGYLPGARTGPKGN
jgi:hypothetical protein